MKKDLDKAQASNNAAVSDFAIPIKVMDGPGDQEETEWTNDKADQYWGYFNAVGDVKSAILMKAIWNVGKGWEADVRTTNILNNIDGWGKDTFDDILFNLDICRRIYGDAFAEIITNDGKTIKEGGILVNLKVLNPADIKIIVNKEGRIKRYEHINIIQGTKEKFEPSEIFHLPHNRIGNQIHGISDIETFEKVILADEQSFEELQKIISFQAKPFIIFKLKTDNDTKIATFVEKVRKARKLGDDMFIPDDENLLSWEVVQVNPSPILMEWRSELRNKFYRQIGIPLVLFGSTGSTESGGKMEVFGHEQVFEHDQRYLEKQIKQQLRQTIDLIPPTSLLPNLQTDEVKDAGQGLEFQRGDTTPGVNK